MFYKITTAGHIAVLWTALFNIELPLLERPVFWACETPLDVHLYYRVLSYMPGMKAIGNNFVN